MINVVVVQSSLQIHWSFYIVVICRFGKDEEISFISFL